MTTTTIDRFAARLVERDLEQARRTARGLTPPAPDTALEREIARITGDRNQPISLPPGLRAEGLIAGTRYTAA